ncbi:hypothetical protein C8F04DRAFT_1164841 [Mycena alexandri]|uniref:Uncharacterized protein n=1 Tax=Mycena alexandri TaxID=1745969 RepID=A0AAD6RWC4_9AGAR|nr:hypothetical protein C8F04DRAFT_1164841 [Mycena alexandri]
MCVLRRCRSSAALPPYPRSRPDASIRLDRQQSGGSELHDHYSLAPWGRVRGETTYVEVAVDGTQGSPSSPAILDIPTPLTLTTTFAEGASAMRESLLLPGEDFAFTCTFSDGRGTCFQSVGVSNPTRSGSVTPHVFTFSGPLAPLYTLPSRAPASLGPGTSASISTPSPTVPTPMPTAVNGAETKIPSCLVYGVLYFMVSILAYIL